MTPKITPHLWYDKEARAAAQHYTSAFGSAAKLKSTTVLPDTPSGAVEIITLGILDQQFTLISAGPLFSFNPSISFLVLCPQKDEVERIWRKLADGGKVRMPLDRYPFSERYGWTSDRFGLNWQVMQFQGKIPQRIIPTLMFTGNVCGQAELAVHFYASVFKDADIGEPLRYAMGEGPDIPGTIKHVGFSLEGQRFAAMDSARVQQAPFNEAISLTVSCSNQKEIDYYWQKLSAHPEAEQCGWLKDRFGLSWQIVPSEMEAMLKDKDPVKRARLTKAFLAMKKFDLAALRKAFNG